MLIAVPSIYAEDYAVSVVAFADRGNYYVQSEALYRDDEVPLTLNVAYTKCENHFYIGDLKTADFIVNDMGVTEQIQPAAGGRTCSIGFNPETQQWFGWSHRATASFGIGTKVSKGDCAFEPSNIAEMEAELIGFWSNDRTEEFEDKETGAKVTFVTSTESTTDYLGPVGENGELPQLGILVKRTTTYSDGRVPVESDQFSPYPEVWGRGEWTAATLEDAKEMAIAFAKGVS